MLCSVIEHGMMAAEFSICYKEERSKAEFFCAVCTSNCMFLGQFGINSPS